MAFVLVQHLAPDHKSILAELVKRYTRMPVYEVEDGMAIEPNCTYIIPPNCDMALLNGTLQLLKPAAPRGHRLPIDFFFRTLAQDQGERAIGIVLSGTGSDGTLGIRSIKGEGGMVMAQNPASAEFDGMPNSSIATRLVDFELPPAEMPARLIEYVSRAFGKLPRIKVTPPANVDSALKKIFVLLRAQSGHDLSLYKPGTIIRRIERRMALSQIESIEAYVEYLKQTATEAEALFRDLLIGVTSFFRDPAVFETLKEQIIPQLLADEPSGSMIRIWVAGCATGEEAYSIAMLLMEHMESVKQHYTVQIFATDINSHAIASARAGNFPQNIAQDLSPERLERFFTTEDDGASYRINLNIREMIVFSEQDVIKDPPFSKLNMISCRNLLIYLSGELQKRLIPLFHYALIPKGMLLLGTSESIGDFGDLFDTVNRKLRLFQRKELSQSLQRANMGWFFPPLTARGETLAPASSVAVRHRKLPLRELTEQVLLQQVLPAAALVTAQGDILYLHGRAGKFLELAEGETAVNNILKMARGGLRAKLTTALLKSAAEKATVSVSGIRVKTNGGFTLVNLAVYPALVNQQAKAQLEAIAAPPVPLFLVTLEEVAQKSRKLGGFVSNKHVADRSVDAASVANNEQIIALQQELQAKDEYLQATVEEVETSNEELKSSNEEMQSVNEELQSTNEELETSKEELQSVNEELATVNTELQTKVADLMRANDDMNNLLAGTGIGTVFVDHQMRIMRFTPTVSQILNLIQSDIGRPVGHIVTNLVDYADLLADTQTVLDTLVPKELEVQTVQGQWYTLRILPYRTRAHVIKGAVINFVDITEARQDREELHETQAILNAALENNRVGIVLADAPNGTVRYVNDAGLKILGGNRKEIAAGIEIDQYLNGWQPSTPSGEPGVPKYPALSSTILFEEGCTQEFLIRNSTDEERYVLTNSSAICNASGEVAVGIILFTDITERWRAEEALKNALEDIKILRGIIPICSGCKKVRDDQGYWNQLEAYLSSHTDAQFSHGMCPDCLKTLYPEYYPKKD